MTKAKEMPPVELLRELFDYNHETGEVRWRVRPPHQPKDTVGKLAGTTTNTGRRQVRVNGQMHQVHRIAFAIYYGEVLLPGEEIDHINRNPLDNRITNLRKVDRSGNLHNRGLLRTNRSGVTGVCYDNERGKWLVHFRKKNLGRYNTLEEAVAARKQAEQEHGVIY